MAGGGKSGQSEGLPHQRALGDLLAGNLMSMTLQRNPAMRGAFGGGELGKSFGEMFPGANAGSMTGQTNALPFYQRALSGMGGGFRPTYAKLAAPTGTYRGAGALSPIPGGTVPDGGKGSGREQNMSIGATVPSPLMGQGRVAGQPPPGWAMAAQHNPNWDQLRAGTMGQGSPQDSQRGGGGMYRGAGALSPVPGATVPTGQPKPLSFAPTGQQAPTGGVMQFQQPTTERIQALTVPQQQYNLLGQVGTEQINRGSQLAQQDLMRQMAARGLGQSGIAMKGAADLYSRGAGQQMSDFARNLAAQRMGAEFGEAQQARGLEAARQQAMAGLGLQTQTAQEQANQAARTAALNEMLGVGQLGLSEQGQQIGAQNALLQSLGGLGQSMIGSGSQQSGKGK